MAGLTWTRYQHNPGGTRLATQEELDRLYKSYYEIERLLTRRLNRRRRDELERQLSQIEKSINKQLKIKEEADWQMSEQSSLLDED